MKQNKQQQIYVSPDMETIETNVQAIICQSERGSMLNSTEMVEGDNNW